MAFRRHGPVQRRPGHERLVEMLEIALGPGNTLPPAIGPLLAEELGGTGRDVGRRAYCTALVALEPEASAGLSGQTVADTLRAAVRRANTELNDAEQIRHFAIVGETWLPGGGELTPTMKLKRKPSPSSTQR